MFQLERMAFFYLPRICNHCLNPGCVASCPSGAIYKRGEDGIVLINQEVCRAWRMCVTACPYKKSYYNWHTGKSEKCILCYPRMEAGYAPACMHSCVGRIRYLGVLLYDADKIEATASVPDNDLVNSHLDIIQDPFDPEVIAAAKANGVPDSTIKAAQNSPTYKFVKEWGMALPLHPEFRTLPDALLRTAAAAGDGLGDRDRRRAEGEAQPHRQDVDRQLALRHQHRGALGHHRAVAFPAQVHGEHVHARATRRPWPTGSRS